MFEVRAVALRDTDERRFDGQAFAGRHGIDLSERADG